jgi:GTP cyclohydrolase I
MSVDIDVLVSAIEEFAPPGLAYEWDNTGLLLRCADKVSRALVTLDVTGNVIDEAEKKGCDIIFSHHPLIFQPIRKLSFSKTPDSLIMRLMQKGISLYSAHTSFDKAAGGMGDVLAKKLELKRIEAVPYKGDDLMRTGFLKKPLSREQLIDYVKRAFEIKYLQASLNSIGLIEKVAVVGGSGGDFIEAAIESGAQAFITGEAKYGCFLEADEMGLLLLAAGHFETECIFIEEAFMSLQSRLNELQLNLDLIKAESAHAPYECV